MHAPGRRGPQRRRPAFGRPAYGVRRCTACAGCTRESLDSRGSCRKGHAMRHRSRAARIGLSAVLARQMDVGWVAAAQRRAPPPVTSKHSRRWGSRGSLARKPAPRAALRPTLRIRGEWCFMGQRTRLAPHHDIGSGSRSSPMRGGSGMNSSWSRSGSFMRPACQSARAWSMRSFEDDTKFQSM